MGGNLGSNIGQGFAKNAQMTIPGTTPGSGTQMQMSQVNPSTLQPEARYAYNQMMASGTIGNNMQGLPPNIQTRQRAVMAKYFPNLFKKLGDQQ
jgi:hypothetical protein